MSKPTSDQLDAANRKVDAAQRELSRVQARGSEIYRQLLEHRSAVLSFSVQRLEKKHSADGDPDDSDSATATFSGDLSPTSTTATSVSISSRTKFEGAHLFAGHADAVTPRKLKAPPSMAQMTQLEEQLKVSKKKEADMTRELTMVNLERNELETRLGLDLQAAEDTISSLRAEVQRVEEMESEIRELRQRVRNQEAELMDYEEGKGNDAKVMELQSAWDRERAEWERERATVGGGGGWAKEKQRLEDDLNFEAETREGLEKDLEAAKAEIRALEGRVKVIVFIGGRGLTLTIDITSRTRPIDSRASHRNEFQVQCPLTTAQKTILNIFSSSCANFGRVSHPQRDA
jgi:predicted  nucleic acid-binding Zn-ribbon protein